VEEIMLVLEIAAGVLLGGLALFILLNLLVWLLRVGCGE
jgi:hypothetical protein